MKARFFHTTVVFLLTFVFSTLNVYAQDEDILIEPPLTWSINSIQIVWSVSQGATQTQEAKLIYGEDQVNSETTNKEQTTTKEKTNGVSGSGGAKIDASIGKDFNPFKKAGLFGAKVNASAYLEGGFNYNQTNRTTDTSQWSESEKRVVSQALTSAFEQSAQQSISNQRLLFTVDFINHTSTRLYFSPNSANTIPVYCGNTHIGDARLISENASIAATGKPISCRFEMAIDDTGKQSLIENRPIIRFDSGQLLIQSNPNVREPVEDAIQESTISTGYFTIAILSGNEVKEWKIRYYKKNPVTLKDAMEAINEHVRDLANNDNKTVFAIENEQLVSVCETLLSKKDDPDWITEIRIIKGSKSQTVSTLDLSIMPNRGERYVFQLINQEIIKLLKKKGNSGDIEAIYEISERYGEGNGIPQNYTEAVKWLRKAAEQGHVKAQNNLADCYLQGIGVEKNFEEAVKWLRKAAEQGHAESQGELGIYYYFGIGVPLNVNEALKWFHKAAEQDNPIGLMGLACCYNSGEGVTKDKKEALKNINKFFELLKNEVLKSQNDEHNSWCLNNDSVEQELFDAIEKAANQGRLLAQIYFGTLINETKVISDVKVEGLKYLLKAAEQGDPMAQCLAFSIYSRDGVVPQNMTESIKWLRKAAEQGVIFAQLILGRFYDSGIGVPADKTEAVKWYRMAAEQGNAEAQDMLGKYLLIGMGVPQNYSEAVKWFRLAAEQEYAESQDLLGWCYNEGKGIPEDKEEAIKWYRKAAEQGLARAQNHLGACYYNGDGVPQNYSEAVKWFRLATEQGFALAQDYLGDCYYYGKGVPQNYSEAVKWYRKAAEQDYDFGQYNLGFCYAYGKGVQRNLSNAKYWLHKAADQGNKDAIELLKRVNSWWW